MVEKTFNAKAKTSLQLLLRIKKIDFRYSKNYKSIKKDKDKANQEY